MKARLIREAGTGQHRAAGNKTVAELLDAWSEWRPRKGEIAERTMLGYRSLIEHKIIPAIGELRLSSCACGRRIRVARSVLELAPILCAACAQPFQPEGDEER